MKKLLLVSALAFGALAINAQDLTVTVGGEEIQNGATVTSYRTDEQLLQFGTLKLDPEVMATVSENANLTVKVTNTTNPGATTVTKYDENGLPYEADVQIQFCWPSECYMISPLQSQVSSSSVGAGEPVNLAIDATIFPYDATAYYEMDCTVKLTVNGSDDSVFEFDLKMIYDPDSGVAGVTEDLDAPAVYYNLNGCKVSNPDKGIYIKKQGNKVTKVIL